MRKTVTLLAYQPHGTRSAVCIELHYRGRIVWEVAGPLGDRQRIIETAHDNARKKGFTHVRRFGESVVTKLGQ